MSFEGWITRRLADGVALFPPGGARDGTIRIRDRRRPLRSARELRDRAVKAIGGVQRLGPIERLATDEGELAALTTTRLASGEHTLGLIFGDDFYTQLDVFTARPKSLAHFREIARTLVSRYGLYLGNVRMRRPFYRPPPGWSGYPRGLATIWYPPGFPGDPSALTVLPAMPIERPAGSLSEIEVAGGVAPRRQLQSSVFCSGDLEGLCSETAEGPVRRIQIRLHDDRFLYGFQLDSPLETLENRRRVLDELLASFEPIPAPRSPIADSFQFWAT